MTDYSAVAALERVQAILRKMESDSWEYVPRMIEREFYVRVPEARRIEGETVQKHAAGYANAAALTGEQTAIVDRLAMNLMGEITDACMTAMATVQSAIIGRIEPDVYRRVGLEQVAAQAAAGRGVNQSVPAFVEALRREGVRAFTDKAGRNWSLHTYCTMASRTTQRQAEVSAVLTADPEQDLYQISSHGTTCSICAQRPSSMRRYSFASEKRLNLPELWMSRAFSPEHTLPLWTLRGSLHAPRTVSAPSGTVNILMNCMVSLL